ncbi:BtpA/SgcQ family protein [bacterium]|nr:BtpA/SgcQ family protein [bacterium]
MASNNPLHSALSFLNERRPAFCAMIHVLPLPGTPRYGGSLKAVIDAARREARTLADAGVDAIMIENMHDAPYVLRNVGPEITAGMTAVGCAVREEIGDMPLGVQVLAGANCEAIAVAQSCGANFIRAEGFVFAHVGDEGTHEACAAELLRYRRMVGAEDIAVLTDIKKKHSAHAITADVDLAETAHAAEFFGSDGLIVTGTATGRPAKPGDLKEVLGATHLPVAIGSGITPENAAEYRDAHLLIVGSWYKRDGYWENEIDPDRVARLVESIRKS